MALTMTIVQTPARNLTYKMYPVYNGLPFVVSTNNFGRVNFKYIADITIGTTKVATLKQNKDISSTNYGVFDIGRIAENFIKSTSPTFTNAGFEADSKAYQSYQVKFGAEYERYMNFQSIVPAGGYAKLQFTIAGQSPDVRVGDNVMISNCSNSYYNGASRVIAVTTFSITISKLYDTNATGTIIEAEEFYDNVSDSFDTKYVSYLIPVTRPTRIKAGDTIVITQFGGAKYLAYNGEWLVTRTYNRLYNGLNYTAIATNCPVIAETPTNPGSIYAINKYVYTGITTSSIEYAFDGALQYADLKNWNPTAYSMSTTAKGKFLTNAPITQYIRLNEDAKLTCFNTSIMGSSIAKGVFKTYNSSGTLLSTFIHLLTSTPASTYAMIVAGVGTKNLVSLFSNALPSTASYYTYELQNSTNVRVSEIRKYIIDRECFRYTQKRFKWKNRMGGWDYFTFNLRSDRTVEIERSNYRKALNTVTNNKYGYTVGNRGNTTYNVNAKDSEIVFSNWLTNDEATWLEELYTSPDVYILDGTNELPIILTDTSLKIGEKENQGLISYSINYEYAFNKVIQRA
jgi:hypothetical protein